MTSQRLSLLDGLRGLAAFAVVLWHYQNFFQVDPAGLPASAWDQLQPGRPVLNLFYDHGYRAVELFWVISGFVFTHVYCFGRQSTAREFAVNRIARLYPLHLVTLLAMAVLQAAAMHRFGHSLFFTHNDPYHFVLNLFLVSGWGFQEGPSYNDVIWSVSVELAIYALFWALHGRLRQWGAPGAALVAAACGLVVLYGPPTFIFACGFYFFVGSAVALAWHRLRGRGPPVLAGLSAVGAAGLVSDNPVVAAVLGLGGSFAAAALLVAMLEEKAGERLRAASRWLGDCSYGIYLWHFPVLVALVLLLSPFVDLARLAMHGWFLATYLGLVLAAARCGYVWIERPARQGLRGLAPRAPRGAALPV